MRTTFLIAGFVIAGTLGLVIMAIGPLTGGGVYVRSDLRQHGGTRGDTSNGVDEVRDGSALVDEGVSSGDDAPPEELLRRTVQDANQEIFDLAQGDSTRSGMGTTLTAAMVEGDEVSFAHVGDSRAYLLRAGEGITQLTTDHTLVEQLVQDGRLSRDEVSSHPQRSVITRAIGVDVDVDG